METGGSPDELRLRVLGPVEASVRDRAVRLTGLQRSLLAILLLNADTVVPGDRLTAGLWGERAPATAATQLRTIVFRLRRAFTDAGAAGGVIVTRPPGYLLRSDGGVWVDRLAFAATVRRAGAAVTAGRLPAARDLYGRALRLWRGPAMADARGPFVETAADQLEEELLSAVEGSVDVDLALGRHRDAVATLTDLVRSHPLRDRPHGQLMLALHRSGRSGEALGVYRAVRRRYADELGIEPGGELRALHQRILRADPALLAGTTTAAPPPADRPATTPPVRPAQLPPDIADLVGRDRPVALAVEALTTAAGALPVLAIYGKPGVGKSALAVRVAHRVRERFPDGQLHVDLGGAVPRPEDPTEVLARFLAALGVPASAVPDHPADRAALYRSRLADRRVLVVLDNAVDEDQVRPLLPGAAGCAVVVTSRVPPAGLAGARLLPLDVLDDRASRRLLDATVGAARIRAEERATGRLVRFCAGLPLALRIAAGRLAVQPNWQVRTLVERLGDDRHRLDELRLDGTAVRASLAESHRALPAADAAAFTALGLLATNDFAAWALAALLDGTVADAERRLDALVRAQLVDFGGRDSGGGARYRMHDLIRAYVVDRAAALPAPDRDAATDRLDGAWLALATGAVGRLSVAEAESLPGPVRPWPVPGGDGTGDPAVWWEAERRNLVATARARVPGGLGWQLAALTTEILQEQGHFDDWRALHLAGLRAAERAGEPRARAAMLFGLAMVDCRLHDLAGARSGYQRALAAYRDLGDEWGQARSEHGLATVLRWTGDTAEALAICRRVADRLLAAGDRRRAAESRHLAAVLHYERGEWDQAVELARRARRGYAAVGQRRGESGATVVLGLALGQCGELGRAERHLRRAVTFTRRHGLTMDHAYSSRALADFYLDRGRHAEARRLLEAGLRTVRGLGDRACEVGFLRRFARLELADGAPAAAVPLAVRAVEVSGPDGGILHADSWWTLGDAHAAAGDPAAAAAAWGRSRELFDRLGSADGPPAP